MFLHACRKTKRDFCTHVEKQNATFAHTFDFFPKLQKHMLLYSLKWQFDAKTRKHLSFTSTIVIMDERILCPHCHSSVEPNYYSNLHEQCYDCAYVEEQEPDENVDLAEENVDFGEFMNHEDFEALNNDGWMLANGLVFDLNDGWMLVDDNINAIAMGA